MITQQEQDAALLKEQLDYMKMYNKIATVIEACHDKFRDYEKLHLAKTPPDFEKARVNCMMAELCEDALK